MKSLLERLRAGRLATTFTILATLSAGILIGSGCTTQAQVDATRK